MNRLFAPVDIASTVYFRIVFGLVMLWEIWRYFTYGWIARYYIDPTFYFGYFGFEWVRPLPGDGMYWLFYGLALLAVCITLGLYYRLVMPLFFVGFTYVFLLDQTRYLNHFYLISVISFVLIFIPAHRAFSLDVLLRPHIRRQTIPAWMLWLLLAQISIAYFYGGVAKLNSDWLAGEPMRMWLANRTDFPVIGPYFTEEWMVAVFTYGGLLFDLFIVPLLLWRRTRPFALVIAAAFHLTNAHLFTIGIFPWFMIAANMMYLPPSWPRLGRRLIDTAPTWQPQRAAPLLAGAFLLVQVVTPLRHHLYPGDVNWTEEGHRFAWHMKLRDKDAEALFYVTDPDTQTTWAIDPELYLYYLQLDVMAGRPDMLLQFAHFLAAEFAQLGYPHAEVRAWAMAALNGREPQLMIDPTTDLATATRTLTRSEWIVPLAQPLDRQPTAMLLISRHDNALVLVNAGVHDFPLARLTLGAGDDAIPGTAWGVDTLAETECVTAGAWQALICNQEANPLPLAESPVLTAAAFTVYLDEQPHTTCEGRTCLVSVPHG